MDKRKSLVTDPSTQKPVSKILLLQRICAVSILQNFYRQYVKWDHDEDGNPIDPIMRDGFDPKNQVRILYKTKVKDSQKIVTKLQVYNVETLLESIKSSKSAINPMTNTKFTREHFNQIVKKAAIRNFIKEEEINSYLIKYGYSAGNTVFANMLSCSCCNNDDHISSYEPVDQEIEKKKITLERDQNLLAYYALLNDTQRVERLVYKNLVNVENGHFKINFTRNPKKKLPEILNPSTNHGAMWNLNRICERHFPKKEKEKEKEKKKENEKDKKKVKIKPIIIKKGEQQPKKEESENTSSKQLNVTQNNETDIDVLDLVELDHDLENALLPDYLKNGYTPIQVCCYHGNNELLLFLLQFGADLNKSDLTTKLLPLHIALLAKQIPLLNTLSMYGINEQLDIESEYGTAMEMASKLVGEYPEIYSVLFGATEIVSYVTSNHNYK